ncbi:MAG: hypothetical protein IJJ44_06195 [Solobacterium sp.]|nr:hypothetical protein [Solobacterium sp.]
MVRKLIQILLVITCIGLYGCKKEDPAETAVKAFLDAMHEGNYEGMVSEADAEISLLLENTYSTDTLLENYPDEELRQAFEEYRTKAIFSQCQSYTIKSKEKDKDTNQTVFQIEVIQLDLDGMDTSYTLDDYADDHKDEFHDAEKLPEEEYQLFLMKSALDYGSALIGKASEEKKTITVSGTITVTGNSDGTYEVTNYSLNSD